MRFAPEESRKSEELARAPKRRRTSQQMRLAERDRPAARLARMQQGIDRQFQSMGGEEWHDMLFVPPQAPDMVSGATARATPLSMAGVTGATGNAATGVPSAPGPPSCFPVAHGAAPASGAVPGTLMPGPPAASRESWLAHQRLLEGPQAPIRSV